jgi:hypothetical protein
VKRLPLRQKISDYFTKQRESIVTSSANQTLTEKVPRQALSQNPIDKLSYNSDDLFTLYLNDDLVQAGIDRPVDAAYNRGFTPEIKATVVEAQAQAKRWARVTGWAAVIKTGPGEGMAAHTYYDSIKWGVKTIDSKDAWDEWGCPTKLDLFMGDAGHKIISKPNFEIVTDGKGVGLWMSDSKCRPVVKKAYVLDRVLENYSIFSLLQSLGFLWFNCSTPQGKNAVDNEFSDPKAKHFFSSVKQHVEDCKWIGPGGNAYDPMPAISYLEARIARHFSLDKIQAGGATMAAQVGQVDFYAVVKEKQRQWLPEARRIIEMLGVKECLEYPDEEEETKPDEAVEGTDTETETKPKEEVKVTDIWFADPAEATTAQQMSAVTSIAQIAGPLSVNKESAIRVIQNLTGWDLEYDAEADKLSQEMAMAPGPTANEPARQKANASAEDSAKDKKRPKSATNT